MSGNTGYLSACRQRISAGTSIWRVVSPGSARRRKMLNKYGGELLAVAAMPLEGSKPDGMLPAIHLVSATEAAFR